MPNKIKFNLSKDDIEGQICKQLASRFNLKKTTPVTRRLSYYDTFDWRLFNRSQLLFSLNDSMGLRKMGDEQILYNLSSKPVPRFIWDFPKSEFKDYLNPLIKMRRLINLVDLTSTTIPYRVLNADEKTVVWLSFETIRSRSRSNPFTIGTQIWITPVKGYNKHAARIKKQIQRLGFMPSTNEDVYFQALYEAGLEPGAYSARLNLKLSPKMRADDATRTIFRFLLKVIKANEAQIKHDIDTEIVHDYRVAIRRTRSALVWDKKIFDRSLIARFQKDLAFVGKLSNELRDLDVYLLNQDKYKAMLPSVLQKDLTPLFEYLAKQRATAFKKVVSGIQSRKYKKIMQTWEAWLNETQNEVHQGPAAAYPILHLASKRINKQYKDVIKSGRQILNDSEDEKLHKLRIKCKKLRYLIQFFANLYPPEKINALVKQLKKLQDVLGDFNDLCVQVDYLLDVSKKMSVNLSQSSQTLVAMGSLIGKLETERQATKDSFAVTFARFTSLPNQMLFQDLFVHFPKKVAS